MINSNNTTGTVGGSNPNTSQPVQPQLQEAGEGARFGRTVSTGDSNNILSVRTPDFSHSQTGRSTTSSPDGRFVKVDDEKAILPNITSPSSVSPHGVSSKGTQWAADEADLKVWQEGRSKPRKMKKRRDPQVLLTSLLQAFVPLHSDTLATRTTMPFRVGRSWIRAWSPDIASAQPGPLHYLMRLPGMMNLLVSS